MTIYGTVGTPLVLGQPISPFFGVQNAGGAPAATLGAIPQPGATITNSVQKPLLDAVARGEMPANALVSTVNGVSVGAQGAGGDPCSIAELISSGNGNQANGGTAAAALIGGLNTQEFAVGQAAPTPLENGPTPVNVDTVGLAPVPASVLVSNVGLLAAGFQG